MLRAIPRRPARSFAHLNARYSTSSDPRSQLEKWKQELNTLSDRARVWGRLTASLLRQRAENLSSSAHTTVHDLGGKLNKVTGYDEIDALKRRVGETEQRISEQRQAAKDAKAAYESAVARRSACQREVNDLLQRKSHWTEEDVVRFTGLVRQDHLNEQTVATSKVTLADREADVEREFNELMRVILNRYHEEQVWSDKIRSASTYGSLLAIGVNILVFVLAIVLVEPWKRKRLAQTFEKRIEEISQENKVMIQDAIGKLSEHFDKQEEVLQKIATSASTTPASVDPTPIPPPSPPPSPPPEIKKPSTILEGIPDEVIFDGVKVAGGFIGGSLLALRQYSNPGSGQNAPAKETSNQSAARNKLKVDHSRFVAEAHQNDDWPEGSPKQGPGGTPAERGVQATRKGRLLPTDSHLFKLVLPLPGLRQPSQSAQPRDAKPPPPTVFLLHPSQPLSHVSSLIQAALPSPTHGPQSFTPRLPLVSFQNAAVDEGLPNEPQHQWSDSTDIGDFVKEAAHSREFTVVITPDQRLNTAQLAPADDPNAKHDRADREAYEPLEIPVSVPSFED
ncbi:sensitivity to high expression protein she9, partial [Tulasnella sp. 427]